MILSHLDGATLPATADFHGTLLQLFSLVHFLVNLEMQIRQLICLFYPFHVARNLPVCLSASPNRSNMPAKSTFEMAK